MAAHSFRSVIHRVESASACSRTFSRFVGDARRIFSGGDFTEGGGREHRADRGGGGGGGGGGGREQKKSGKHEQIK